MPIRLHYSGSDMLGVALSSESVTGVAATAASASGTGTDGGLPPSSSVEAVVEVVVVAVVEVVVVVVEVVAVVVPPKHLSRAASATDSKLMNSASTPAGVN